MLNIFLKPLLEAVAMKAMSKAPGKTDEENEKKGKEVVKEHLKPWYKQKTFWSAIAVIVAGVLNSVFNLGIPVDALFCGGI